MKTSNKMSLNTSLIFERQTTVSQKDFNSKSQVKELLLVLPVPFFLQEDQLFLDSQACNGLERWADNFGSVILAAPVKPPKFITKENLISSKNLTSLAGYERFEFVPLPWAYSLPKFLFYYHSIRFTLAELISRCRYLQFAIGGLWGDWASIAALEAHKQKRPYAIHTDRVEHLVLLKTANQANLKDRIKTPIISFLMAHYHQWIIKNSSLGLWHGNDCYSAYSNFCSNNYLIHNIHVKSSESISSLALRDKLNTVTTESALKICYVGRIEAMKAPLDWVKAIHKAKELGANIKATWFGQGSLVNEMKTLIKELDLTSCIELPGYESEHKILIEKIKKYHLMLFTHITPESPRCLLESLICGTPIIGYRSPFVEDLVKDFGGGMFVSIHDWQQLGEVLAHLSKQRYQVTKLIEEAANNGKRFNDEAVFRERSELIKNFLN